MSDESTKKKLDAVMTYVGALGLLEGAKLAKNGTDELLRGANEAVRLAKADLDALGIDPNAPLGSN